MTSKLLGNAALVFVCVAGFGLAIAQSEPVQNSVRSDAEILEGMEVYVANLEFAYAQLKLERDELEVKVRELEEELGGIRN